MEQHLQEIKFDPKVAPDMFDGQNRNWICVTRITVYGMYIVSGNRHGCCLL